LRWLWGVVTEQITYCQILPGRGFAQAASILGAKSVALILDIDLKLREQPAVADEVSIL